MREYHFYMLTLMVMYKVGDAGGIRYVNTTMYHVEHKVPAMSIQMSQRSAANQVMSELQEAFPAKTVQITDVILFSSLYCGKMTHAEFMKDMTGHAVSSPAAENSNQKEEADAQTQTH